MNMAKAYSKLTLTRVSGKHTAEIKKSHSFVSSKGTVWNKMSYQQCLYVANSETINLNENPESVNSLDERQTSMKCKPSNWPLVLLHLRPTQWQLINSHPLRQSQGPMHLGPVSFELCLLKGDISHIVKP